MATNLFQGFGSTQQNSFPAFGNSALPTPAFPSFGNTPSPSAPPLFGNAQPFGTPQPQNNNATNTANSNNEKGQIIQCLTESKNVQLAILNELKQVNEKLKTTNATPQFPPPPSASSSLFAPPVFPTPGQAVTKNIHIGVFCNGCMKNNIAGVRYKCLVCKDFDLCEDCEAKAVPVHDSTHVFIKIKDTQVFTSLIEKKTPLFNTTP